MCRVGLRPSDGCRMCTCVHLLLLIIKACCLHLPQLGHHKIDLIVPV